MNRNTKDVNFGKRLEHLFRLFRQRIKALLGIRPKPVIRDYSYTPKHRDSLKDSKIGDILESWYVNNQNEVTELIRKFCSFKEFYKHIPLDPAQKPSPHWQQTWIPPFDAMSIYGFLAIHNPRYYVEVGSGNTTLFAAQAINDHRLRTKIISIDPFPRALIDKLCHQIYRMPFEDMDVKFFTSLTAEDFFLLDNSHRSFPNSDVTVFFTEVLPVLPSGILYAMHDIFLPSDYPKIWTCMRPRWYNEQYLLCAYLLGGADSDKIQCPVNFLGSKDGIIEIFQSLREQGEVFVNMEIDEISSGSLFWLRKG